MKLIAIFNTVLHCKYIPTQWKMAEIVVLLKPDKPPAEAASYRSISLLLVIGKFFEKLYIQRLNEIVKQNNLIIDAQFGSRAQDSTTDQLHRITKFMEDMPLKKGNTYCVRFF